MRVEGKIDNCIGCDYLRDQSSKPWCGRIGKNIDKMQVCNTGPMVKFPDTPEELEKLSLHIIEAWKVKAELNESRR